MIIIATKDQALAEQIRSGLQVKSNEVRIVDLSERGFLHSFYDLAAKVIIADEQIINLPPEAAVDIYNSLGRRIPVLILKDRPIAGEQETPKDSDHLHEQLTILHRDQVKDIITTANVLAGVSEGEGIKAKCQSIPFFNPQIPISMLKNFGGLGILTIDASSFNKISVEYGTDVYNKVKLVFHDILFSLWGRPGCFRDSDVICRKSMISNTYLIFMNRSRETGALPYPGALERVADRISQAIHNALWEEMFAPRGSRRIPNCLQSVPLVGVGFFGVLHNPCIDVQEILDSGLEASKQMAVAQQKRGKERQRELMQTLIQSDELLRPYYQGVFNLQTITKEIVDQVNEDKSIAPLKDHIYGFESLIRVNQQAVDRENCFDSGVDSKYLRPDVLFSMAKYTKVALELDQACMKHAARGALDLPGVLMVNILPRNLYYIDRLKMSFDRIEKIMFEVSESEAINNLELMLKTRDHLEKHNMGIAADDFGKGYSSLERIIKIKPHLIKFDRGMITDIHKDPVKQAYVRGLVKAAKILNTIILAEGVELWEEAAVLKDMGVELIQGFLLHRPEEPSKVIDQIGDDDKSDLETVA